MKNKLTLQDVEWKEFKIKDLFKIKRGKRLIEKNRHKGDVPYISATSSNNGITDFINNPLFIENNKLVVTTFCDSYYIEGNFTASDEITMLGNKNLNKYNGLFLSSMIKTNQSKYAFGRKAFTDRISTQIIMLPIDKNGNPNWQFMEDYIKQEEKEIVNKVVKYYQNRLDEIFKNVAGGGADTKFH
ncbi:restriction endonuclease subunit S [Campylobacter blaseri]|uniref:restriction endonuclease subunit S n=1 Tax=Campylobacter blaseri TaxID=2042961 RepID=UPI0019D43C82|nr:restriction endonuclease subunit S [Campylobacter blaseri]